MATPPSSEAARSRSWLRTPDLGTGLLEHRERVHFAELRSARRARVLEAMDEQGLDACLFGREGNARYLTGVRRLWTAQTRPFTPTCAVVRATAAVHLLSFSASYEGIPEELRPDDVFPVTWSPARFIGHVTATPGLREARRIGVDGMTFGFQRLLTDALPGVELVAAESMMRALRRRKLPEELTCIRTASAIAESALLEAARRIAPGVREKELQAEYLARLCELGTSQFAQQGSFTAIGPQGGLRWITGERRLEEGSLVALSGGALWAGYEGSLARTWWCGERSGPGREERALHALGSDAVTRLVARCRPGVAGAELRSELAASDAGRAGASFAVGCVGLGSEGPIAATSLDPAVEERESVAADMVLGVRVFVPGAVGGYLHEEMVAVGERGCEAITTLGHGPLAGGEKMRPPEARGA
jgi:Xaa-Pro dipeptidase